jgi:hypothetical protein
MKISSKYGSRIRGVPFWLRLTKHSKFLVTVYYVTTKQKMVKELALHSPLNSRKPNRWLHSSTQLLIYQNSKTTPLMERPIT